MEPPSVTGNLHVGHYLPHHAVVRDDKKITKLCIALGQKSNFLLFCVQGNVQDRAGNVQDRAGNVQDRAEFPAEFPVQDTFGLTTSQARIQLSVPCDSHGLCLEFPPAHSC